MDGMEILQGFHQSLQNLYNNEEFSDLTIKCKGTEIKVHKMVLACHSQHFKKMFSGPWTESKENVLEIKDFEPAVVEAMLRFMYDFHYAGNKHADTTFHVKVHECADYYAMDVLKNMAAENFRSVVGWVVTQKDLVALIEYLYASPDLGLRNLILDRITERIDVLLDQDWFDGVMVSVPEFAAAMYALE
ncbi:uncharacterized protein FIESC28_08730 [Fusarium coffeatum]|uniref:BTB domain-containing protein n=1 Tax=Fusarium coffeatum TaxID=231269 RepID=A0A366R4Z8_9HYPO|nr:uncharacterized protein FIESC28_08730 [Fusarium coffeatum]RBR12244.1 hypothetical protein FIESC28_08730 [Fusarium coffeatum]